MKHRAFRKARLALGLTALVMVAAALGAVTPAVAATQHWASASPATQIAEGTSQSFTAKNVGSVQLKWKLGGGTIVISCSSLTASGNVGNPSGGGSGTLGGTSLTLAGCTTNVATCTIVSGSIPFEPIKGYARNEAGERVRFEPNTGATLAVVKFAGGSCTLPPSAPITGYFEAVSNPTQSGRYSISGTPQLKMVGSELDMGAELSLAATSGQSLTLSSLGSPGIPHWFLASGSWAALSAGASTSYWSTAVPLTLNTKIAGAKVEISGCEGIYAGSVENPTGGGAGTASSTFQPEWASGCQINTKGCFIESADTVALTGTATEVGGVPAVEWSPSSGTSAIVFHLNSTCTVGTLISFKGKLIGTSVGDGRFNLAASQLKVGAQAVTVNSEFGLETQLGNPLRLQP